MAASILLRRPSALPGFNATLGPTVPCVCVVVLLPLSAVLLRTSSLTWQEFLDIVSAPRAVASYRITFGMSLLAACTNALFGLVIAWVLARYRFPGRRVIDALVVLPFALPTAVAGIPLASLYSSNGWIGRWLEPYGLKVAFTPVGIFVALTFVGVPFVVRTVQPVLEDL